MTPTSTGQLDLLETPAGDARGRRRDPCAQLVLVVNHRQWMRFLTEEWLFPTNDAQLMLGVGHPVTVMRDGEQSAMSVGIWFDPGKLPALEVQVLNNGQWSANTIDQLNGTDVIAWNGPLPLFAVERFTIGDEETRSHLMAMARTFADMELPPQPIEIDQMVPTVVAARSSSAWTGGADAEDWNSRRGAASMALWAVPTVGPWFDLLCGWLGNAVPSTSAAIAHAPWLSLPPWTQGAKDDTDLPMLWRAMLGEFTQPDLLKEWRPRELLEGIANRAGRLGEDDARVDRLVHTTTALLQDRGTVRELGLRDDPLALALQLLLLRPSPEQFVTWREDWPAIPPGSWWTGAILSGYLSGFRALPLAFRGSSAARKLLALRTWQTTTGQELDAWEALSPDPIGWQMNSDVMVINSGSNMIAEHKVSTRGRWYAANLHDPATRQIAEDIARDFCPHCIVSTLLLTSGEFGISMDGKIRVDSKKRALLVQGDVAIAIGPTARIERRLDEAAFRTWLSSAGIPHRLPKLSATVQTTWAQPAIPSQPKGLRLLKDFVSPDEESALLADIDTAHWDDSMSRRVQHYGWRYDYKARKVQSSGYLGPLPSWAQMLAERLHNAGLVPELPDQVIVNEYVGPQGIAKHIDCPSCFRGPIVTISLIESWEMVFSRKAGTGDTQKFEILLSSGSAAILDGEARHVWQHEIPRKKGTPPRGRRVSITFRKVNV